MEIGYNRLIDFEKQIERIRIDEKRTGMQWSNKGGYFSK